MFNFHVEVCDQKEEYHDGDLVTGSVLLDLSSDETIHSVKVRFSGVATTKVSRKTTQVVYFETTKELYSGNFTLRRGKHDWSFDFRFPSSVEPVLKIHGHSITLPLCQLPPSVITDPDIPFGNDAKIRYFIDAIVERYPGTNSGPRIARKMLHYSPFRLDEEVDVRYAEAARSLFIQSVKLTQHYAEKDLTSKDKAKVWLFGAKDSIAAFRVTLDIPSALIIGQRIPITLSLRTNPAESTCSSFSSVRIDSWDVEVDIITQISSAPQLPLPDRRGLSPQRVYDIGALKLDHIYNIVPFRLKSALEYRNDLRPDGSSVVIGHILGSFKDTKKTIQPSFENITVAQKHELRISIRFVCAGTSVEVQWSKIPVKIVSGGYTISQVPVTENSVEEFDSTRPDLPPPSYDSVAV